MAPSSHSYADSTHLESLASQAVDLAHHWVHKSARIPLDPAARRLAEVLKDPAGLTFTVNFVDRVIRPHDPKVAAHNLTDLSAHTPQFLSAPLRGAVKMGGLLAPVAPRLVVSLAHKTLRALVAHLIIDSSEKELGRAITHLRKQNVDLNINLLGEAVLGNQEAQRRFDDTKRLLRRPDVDYVSVKVSSLVAPHSRWANDSAQEDICARLEPLLELAQSFSPHKFINFDMEEFKDLDLTLGVFMTLLDNPKHLDLKAGIVLQAYLPDAYGALETLQAWSAARVARGGAPIKVRLVKGANLPMERVESEIRGWPLAIWPTKQDTDSAYKAMVDLALRPEHIPNVQVGIAGHNIFDIALAHLLATERGVNHGLEFEMLLGMASSLAQVISQDVGRLLLYTPVVNSNEFDVAISYLVRRLEEGASEENFMSALHHLGQDPALFDREELRFRKSVARASRSPQTTTYRTQNRATEQIVPQQRFTNCPDTEPDLPANQAWAREIFAAIPDSQLGMATLAENQVAHVADLEQIILDTKTAATSWQDLGSAERANILRAAGAALAQRRGQFLEVMASECGKTLDQGDPEISEAIDFANYYADQGQLLERVQGATFHPSALTVVTPPWNFPLAIPAGSVLAALAAGSAVILKPASQAKRCGAELASALWSAGVPREVLRLVDLTERDLGSQLIGHPSVDRVILTGGYETAQLFKSLRPDLPLLAETSGKNAIIVTPNADFDLAALDIARSAFGHAGQKCSAASLLILVGSVAESTRFRNQLLDAVTSMPVGMPSEPRSLIGPVIEPPGEKLLRGLTQLNPGEHWVLKPRALDEAKTLWTPGIRGGVAAGSDFHQTEFFGPVLGIMRAPTLSSAIELANDTAYGLTSGLQSLDVGEMEQWLDQIEAGNAYINRTITGAIVRRQPFGGWKRSAIGPGTKAGGPNYLFSLGTWSDAPLAHTAPEPRVQLDRLDPRVQGLFGAARCGLDHETVQWLSGALNSDLAAEAAEFGAVKDVSGLKAERNALRYVPVPVTIWLAADPNYSQDEHLRARLTAQLIREVSAGLLASSALTVRVPKGFLSASMFQVLTSTGIKVLAASPEDSLPEVARVRLLTSQDASTLRTRLISEVGVDTAVYAGEVVTSGRVTGLTYRQEQAISETAHRFGTATAVPRVLTDNR